MRIARHGLGAAFIALLASLAVSGPALAETNKEWCEANNGTWKGATGKDGTVSTSAGICSFGLVAQGSDQTSRARAKLACTNVGGRVSDSGGRQMCSVSSANLARARVSAEFRASTSAR
jgi:hypothetical protein